MGNGSWGSQSIAYDDDPAWPDVRGGRAPVGRRLSVAIVALSPDAGHVTPLLKIGAMLASRGHQVACLLPDESSALATSYGFANRPIGSALSPVALRAREGFGGSTVLAASCEVYTRDYAAAIFSRSVELVTAIMAELTTSEPDLVLVDNFQFPEIFAGISAEIDVPVLFHDSVGGVHSRSGPLVEALYGKSVPTWRAAGILACAGAYRLYRDLARRLRFRRLGLHDSIARAHEGLRTILTQSPPSAWAHDSPSSVGTVSRASRTMRYHVATGLGLLECRVRGLPPHPDRRMFGPILDTPYVPLPATLEHWLDRQPHGSVLYVSFGSTVRLSARRQRVLTSALRSLNTPVLWATRDARGTLSQMGLPDTCRIEEFVPQCSTLAHPAIGACLTHGGMGTVLECLAARVPMIVLPVMWDQPYNAQFVHDLGAGVRVDWWRLDATDLASTVRTVLRSTHYRERVRAIAAELRAQNGSQELLKYLEEIPRPRRTRHAHSSV